MANYWAEEVESKPEVQRQVAEADGRALAEKLGYLHFETSAKVGSDGRLLSARVHRDEREARGGPGERRQRARRHRPHGRRRQGEGQELRVLSGYKKGGYNIKLIAVKRARLRDLRQQILLYCCASTGSGVCHTNVQTLAMLCGRSRVFERADNNAQGMPL